MVNEMIVKEFEKRLDISNQATFKEQVSFWNSMKKYLSHGRKENLINGRTLEYLINNLEELIKLLEAINCTKHEIILILTSSPSILNGVNDLYNKYLFLAIIENNENNFRKTKLIGKAAEYRISLNKIYQRYCLLCDLDYPYINWNILVHASDKEFADVFICRTYKKPYQKFITVEEVLRQLNTYDINNLDIEYYKSLDINRELVEKYEGCKRRK